MPSTTHPQSPAKLSCVIGFDDAPFPAGYAGNVKVVGMVYAGLRLDGVLIGEVEKDGMDAAEKLIALISQSKFAPNLHLVMLQGIALGGFNVVDVFALHEQLALPVLVVSRRLPNMEAIKNALLTKVRGGREKWAVIEKLGPMEPAGSAYVQRVGLTHDQAVTVVKRLAIEGSIPEPLRVAHLIAGAIADGQSRGRA
ncbi:MAG: DUF99 family protein [Anaerolineae bacterium]|nr:DUF99 family protein [Anaerolineae bacterium]